MIKYVFKMLGHDVSVENDVVKTQERDLHGLYFSWADYDDDGIKWDTARKLSAGAKGVTKIETLTKPNWEKGIDNIKPFVFIPKEIVYKLLETIVKGYIGEELWAEIEPRIPNKPGK